MMTNVTIEVEVDDAYEQMLDQLKEDGVAVDAILSQELQPSVEDGIHQVYQMADKQGE